MASGYYMRHCSSEMHRHILHPTPILMWLKLDATLKWMSRNVPPALAGVAQWIECWTANQRVSSSIPIRAHARVAGQVPSEGARARGNCTLVFLSLSFSLPSCLRDKNNLLKKKKKETCLLFFLPIKPTIIKFMGLLMESEKQGNDSMCVFPSGLSIHASRGQNVTAYCFSHSIIFPPKRWSVYI